MEKKNQQKQENETLFLVIWAKEVKDVGEERQLTMTDNRLTAD